MFDQHGRDGRVEYREQRAAIHGYFEFGGGDVVAIVAMGSIEAWQQRHAWALPRRVPILRAVADEAIGHWAPRCAAEINEETG